MKTTTSLAILCLLAFSKVTFAQRYLTEIYTQVSVNNDVIYGNNKSHFFGSVMSEDLKMDVYQATGDTLKKRPVIIFLHTGGFIMQAFNQSPTGSKTDSAVVEMCSQFAKRGYVAIAMTYRKGWNPTATDQDERTGTLLNAVYRAVQDVRTCVRFLKRDVITLGNTYKIDTTRIVVGGQGSGSYVALAVATLNKSSELTLAKFMNFSLNPEQPYVNPAVTGDFEGLGGDPASNTPNWPGYNSKINMVFNMGGAIGDSSWMEAGEAPIVSFHCVLDPFAPYTYGGVIVPSTGYFVVNVSGSHDLMARASRLGNNNGFLSATYTDPYSIRANTVNDGINGLFPFVLPAVTPASKNQSAPWEWWSSTNSNSASGLENNPDMSKNKAMAYIDTLMGYLNPRIVAALNLSAGTTGTFDMDKKETSVSLYPNPSSGKFTIAIADGSQNFINSAEICDIMGRAVKNYSGLSTASLTVEDMDLVRGMYFVKMTVGNRIVLKKMLIE